VRVAGKNDVPPCPIDALRGSRVQSYGTRKREDETSAHRHVCVAGGRRHTFTACFSEASPPASRPTPSSAPRRSLDAKVARTPA